MAEFPAKPTSEFFAQHHSVLEPEALDRCLVEVERGTDVIWNIFMAGAVKFVKVNVIGDIPTTFDHGNFHHYAEEFESDMDLIKSIGNHRQEDVDAVRKYVKAL